MVLCAFSTLFKVFILIWTEWMMAVLLNIVMKGDITVGHSVSGHITAA